VFYGNIGSKERLDFTVIGPAVNEVSRIAAMCRSVDQPLLVSSAFAVAMGETRSRLVSVGRYALRGIGRPQELFTVGATSSFSAGLLGALLLLDLVLPRRLFCRALCPAGALANFLRTRRTLRISSEPARCSCADRPSCQAACAWGVDPRRAGRFDGCTMCLACLDACPAGNLTVTHHPP